jgi:hypothetical protein
MFPGLDDSFPSADKSEDKDASDVLPGIDSVRKLSSNNSNLGLNPQEQLEHAQQVIKKYLDEIKKINNGEVDVMSLENRTYLLAKGYLNIETDSD